MQRNTIWQLDFNGLPLRDGNDKRVWELLVCDGSGQFKQARYCTNQQVNSNWVAEQLKEYLTLTTDPPVAIRVFRSRMSSILERGCELAEIPMRPSRRVYALTEWMQQRAKEVYPFESDFTYKPDPNPPIELERPDPVNLPDSLQGERWALVTLQVADLQAADQWPTQFGELIDLDWSQWDPQAMVPGLVIASKRAVPMAAWMSGLDPAFLQVEDQALILDASQVDRYRVARLTTDKTQAEGSGFLARKQQVDGIHFLAIQTDLQAQSFAGFWLLKDWQLPA